jgi:hypothetical protein
VTNDLAIFRQLPDGSVVSALADAASGGEVVTGVDKLLQKVVKLLMTPRGSVPYQATEGTNFVSQLRSGHASTEADVIVGFAAASAAIRASLKGEQSVSDDPDEVLTGLKLNRILVLQGAVDLDIAIKSAAGTVTSRIVRIPFTL